MPRDAMEDTDLLIARAVHGDAAARAELLTRHRDRLTRMVKLRMDPCLAPRFDPSDVVQEALLLANAQMDDYLRTRPVALYPWLRKLAWERLLRLRDEHLKAQKRSVTRERQISTPLSNESVRCLVNHLAANVTSPSEHMVRSEVRQRIQAGLKTLHSRDREILELLYLEQLTTTEAAEVLEISPGSVRTRHFRALKRLTQMLYEHEG